VNADTARARSRAAEGEDRPADHRYYVLDDPELTDAEYDALVRQLQALEATSGAADADSPTPAWPDAVRALPDVTHRSRC